MRDIRPNPTKQGIETMTTTVDTTPVMTTPAGAAMNAMFAEQSVQSVPNGPAVAVPGQQPQYAQPVQPTPDGAAPPQVIDPSQPDSLIPFHHQQQMLQQMMPGQEPQPGQIEQPPVVDPNAPQRQADGEMVPVGRFRQVIAQRNAEADRYRALEADFNRLAGYVQAMMANPQQPQGQQSQAQQPQQVQLPDPGLDPAGFVRAMQEQTQQMVEQATRQVQTETQRQLEAANAQVRYANMKASEASARATYGPQAGQLINAATTAAVRAGLKDQFMSQPDPVGSAIRWYQQQVTQQRYGADPNTVRARVGAELMRDPQFVQQVAQQLRQGVPPQQRPAIPPPPSAIPRAANAAGPMTMYSNGGQAVAQMLAQRMAQGMRAN